MSIYRCESCDNIRDNDVTPLVEVESYVSTVFQPGRFDKKVTYMCEICEQELDEEDEDE